MVRLTDAWIKGYEQQYLKPEPVMCTHCGKKVIGVETARQGGMIYRDGEWVNVSTRNKIGVLCSIEYAIAYLSAERLR